MISRPPSWSLDPDRWRGRGRDVVRNRASAEVGIAGLVVWAEVVRHRGDSRWSCRTWVTHQDGKVAADHHVAYLLGPPGTTPTEPQTLANRCAAAVREQLLGAQSALEPEEDGG